MRELRAVGWVVAAIFSCLAISATTAGAATFQAAGYPAEVKGQQEGEHVLTGDGLTVKCKTATLSGELSKASEELELTPSYAACVAGGAAATVAPEGCKYRLQAGASDVDIVCPAGKAIKVTAFAGTCEALVGSQNNVLGIEYLTTGGSQLAITAKAGLKAIKYTKAKDGVFCPFMGIGTKEDGTLTGSTLLKAFRAAVQVSMFAGTEWQWPEQSEAEPSEGEWPEEEGSPEEEEAAGRDPILFVHGYRGDQTTFATMIARFETDGWPNSRLHNWAYDSTQSNVVTAEQVSLMVDALREITGASKVDIVTHSMGGLSSRHYIKFMGGTAKVDDWVSLGGPNHGTDVANFCFTTACVEMRPDSAFLTELNEGEETPGEVSYETWRTAEGCDLTITPAESVSLAGATNELIEPCVGHINLHENEAIYKEVREFVIF